MHARANAVALTSELPGQVLLRALNGIAPDIVFTHARAVPDSFRPRQAEHRWYRYYEPAEGRRLATWRSGARLLTGPLDARSFGRGFPASTPAARTVDSIEIASRGELFEVDVRARSFVWGMVRKIIGALRAFDAGDLTEADLVAGAAGRRRLSLPLAEPDALVLWEVGYPEPWEFAATRASAAQHRAIGEARRGLTVRAAVLDALEGVVPSPPPGNRAVGL